MLKTEFDLPLSESEWKEFVRAKGFGEMIAFGRGREFPIITPTHFIFDGNHIVELHVHAANPLLRALREHNAAVLSVVGAASFIPSSWNCEAGNDPCWSAPTSYYAAVQLRGTAEILEQDKEIASLLNRQARWFSARGGDQGSDPRRLSIRTGAGSDSRTANGNSPSRGEIQIWWQPGTRS